MNAVLGYTIGGIFVYIFYFCCWYKVANKKIEWGNYKLYLFAIIFILLGSVINFYTTPFLKMILISVVIYFMAYSLVFKDFKRSLIAIIICQLIMMVSEVIFVFLVGILNLKLEEFFLTVFGNIFINFGISLLASLFLFTKIPNLLDKLFITSSDSLKTNKLIRYTLIMIILASFFTTISYMHLDKKYVLIINTIIVATYIIIIYNLTKTQNKYQKISDKYSSSITSLNEYESMIEKYRTTNHESKNELNHILTMVMNNDPETADYIQSMLKTKININDKILKQTAKIPSGGLRATIHSKLCIMDREKIKYSLFISKEIKTSELIELNEEVILNICKIMGVYLDNAIEAVSDLKEKKIIVELYKNDQKFCIDITNNFTGNLDISLMDKPGYTTKGNGHGYGLSLVSEIVSSDKRLSTERSINNDRITHTLIVNLD